MTSANIHTAAGWHVPPHSPQRSSKLPQLPHLTDSTRGADGDCTHLLHLFFCWAAASPCCCCCCCCRASAIRPLTHVLAIRFTMTRLPSPRTSTYTSTMLRAVRPASAAFSPAVAPYLCVTAAETAAPPASTSRTAEASMEARMSAAESATLVRVRSGPVDAGAGATAVGACCA